MFQARRQAQVEDAVDAKHVRPAQTDVGSRYAQARGKVVDGVDPLAERRELRWVQAETRKMDVFRHCTYGRSTQVLPDFYLFKSGWLREKACCE